MHGIFIRWLISTVSILITAYLLDGIHVSGFFTAFFAAAILGILNAFFRPLMFVITLPINIVTLGLFTFVINAILLLMVAGVISGFEIAGFWSALLGSLLISLVSWLITSFINERGKVQYIDMRKAGKGKWKL